MPVSNIIVGKLTQPKTVHNILSMYFHQINEKKRNLISLAYAIVKI